MSHSGADFCVVRMHLSNGSTSFVEVETINAADEVGRRHLGHDAYPDAGSRRVGPDGTRGYAMPQRLNRLLAGQRRCSPQGLDPVPQNVSV